MAATTQHLLYHLVVDTVVLSVAPSPSPPCKGRGTQAQHDPACQEMACRARSLLALPDTGEPTLQRLCCPIGRRPPPSFDFTSSYSAVQRRAIPCVLYSPFGTAPNFAVFWETAAFETIGEAVDVLPEAAAHCTTNASHFLSCSTTVQYGVVHVGYVRT